MRKSKRIGFVVDAFECDDLCKRGGAHSTIETMYFFETEEEAEEFMMDNVQDKRTGHWPKMILDELRVPTARRKKS